LQNGKKLVLFLILTVLASSNLYALVLRKSPVPSASAVETGPSIGVYWDQGCTQSVDSISWGTLQVGGTQEVDVYVRNEGSDAFNLALAAQDWQPGNAYDWLSFSWSCGSATVGPGQVVEVALTLGVASDFSGGFSGFSFSIGFKGGSYLLGDINKDGVVDQKDLAILAAAYGSHCANYDYQGEPASPNWNPLADLNGDGVVNLLDLLLLANDWGKTSVG